MPAEVRFVTLDEVLVIHELMLRDFGGSPGVRDMGLLESGTCDRERLEAWINASVQRHLRRRR